MKNIILPALAVAAVLPAAALAENVEERRFEHGGSVYSYTVQQVGGYRLISGIEEKSGKPFKLRVGESRVRGTVGSQEVNFALKEVKSFDKPATTLAAR